MTNEQIKKEINDNVCVVAGQSGVGKSTLINLFDNFNIKTDEISKAWSGMRKREYKNFNYKNIILKN